VNEPEKKSRLSVDEILNMASDIARDESASGADRMRAMKMITAMESGGFSDRPSK